MKRPFCAINLDPANDYIPYEHSVDIKVGFMKLHLSWRASLSYLSKMIRLENDNQFFIS